MAEVSKFIVVKAYDSDEHNTHAEFAHFELTPAFISILRDYLATAQMVKERHSTAFRVEFWDYSVTYFFLDCDAEDELDEDTYSLLEKAMEKEKPAFFDKMPETLERYLKASEGSDHPLIAHTECDVLKVDCDGDFHWKALLKHTSIRLDTATLTLKDLEDGLKG